MIVRMDETLVVEFAYTSRTILMDLTVYQRFYRSLKSTLRESSLLKFSP